MGGSTQRSQMWRRGECGGGVVPWRGGVPAVLNTQINSRNKSSANNCSFSRKQDSDLWITRFWSHWVFWVLSGIHNSTKCYRSHESAMLKLQEAQSLFKVPTFDEVLWSCRDSASNKEMVESISNEYTWTTNRMFPPNTFYPLPPGLLRPHLQTPTSFHLNYTPVKWCDCMVSDVSSEHTSVHRFTNSTKQSTFITS